MSVPCVDECMSVFSPCVRGACVPAYGDEGVPVGPQGAV